MGGQVSGGMGTRGDDVSRLDGEQWQQCFSLGVEQAMRMVRRLEDGAQSRWQDSCSLQLLWWFVAATCHSLGRPL